MKKNRVRVLVTLLVQVGISFSLTTAGAEEQNCITQTPEIIHDEYGGEYARYCPIEEPKFLGLFGGSGKEQKRNHCLEWVDEACLSPLTDRQACRNRKNEDCPEACGVFLDECKDFLGEKEFRSKFGGYL